MAVFDDIKNATSITDLKAIVTAYKAQFDVIEADLAAKVGEIRTAETQFKSLQAQLKTLNGEKIALEDQLKNRKNEAVREAVENRVWQLEFRT